ncbi:hypothetical protein Tco_0135160 [Tanacetum coccineum]
MERGDIDRCVMIALKKDGPARRRGRQQTDATFDLPGAYFSSKMLMMHVKPVVITGIQNEIAYTSEARAAIYGSAHVTNQAADTCDTASSGFKRRKTDAVKNEACTESSVTEKGDNRPICTKGDLPMISV